MRILEHRRLRMRMVSARAVPAGPAEGGVDKRDCDGRDGGRVGGYGAGMAVADAAMGLVASSVAKAAGPTVRPASVTAAGAASAAVARSAAARSAAVGLAAVGLAAVAMLCLAACSLSSHRLIGTPRPAISPDQVKLYTETPAQPFAQIALVEASSKRSWSFTYEGKAEAVIRRLKAEAAKVGANGVLLKGISEESGGALGTDLGTNYEGPRGTIDVGVGASAFLVSRYGSGIAIYIAPD